MQRFHLALVLACVFAAFPASAKVLCDYDPEIGFKCEIVGGGGAGGDPIKPAPEYRTTEIEGLAKELDAMKQIMLQLQSRGQ